MGNYKFKLSDMMPNAWFYKLRDMSKPPRNQNASNPIKKKLLSIGSDDLYSSWKSLEENRRDFPRKWPAERKLVMKRKTVYKPSATQITPSVSDDFAGWEPETEQIPGCFQLAESFLTSPDLGFLDSDPLEVDGFGVAVHSPGDGCIIDMKQTSTKIDGFISLNPDQPELPPIVTKHAGRYNNITDQPPAAEYPSTVELTAATDSAARRSVSRSKGVKIRADWHRTKSKKSEIRGKIKPEKMKKAADRGCWHDLQAGSFAMVKSSLDPEKDFIESMTEMIVEKKMKDSKELEELLACYLSLNSNEYHEIIIKAFEQIWLSMPIIPSLN